MSADLQALGESGERIAEQWLRDRGWVVLARRFRNGHRDLDLIVKRDGVVAFVEVKARRSVDYGHPVEAVNWRKQRELSRSAKVWIDRFGVPGSEYRFDVVGVLVAGGKAAVSHVENAFPVRGC